jgi:ABC-type iron transport system FetAB ATPase subunit
MARSLDSLSRQWSGVQPRATETAVRLRIAGLRGPRAGPFDLTADAGDCIAISGASGSGKSMFLRMIADLDPNTGEVYLDGVSRAAMPAPAWRRRVVYNAAEPGWWHDDVASHFAPDALAFARDVGPRLGLSPGLLDAAVTRLSTGEKQRLALIRALALTPPVLLLDEPTGALDPDTTLLVENVLRDRLAAGTTILFVSHSEDQARRLGNRRLRMENGGLVPA